MNLGLTIDKGRLRQAFSRQAPVYEENAALQKEVAEELVSKIPPIPPLSKGGEVGIFSRLTALDIGIGTGFAAKGFIARFPGIKTHGCDIAWGMLKESGKTGAVLSEADAEHLPYKDESFDLAFSSLALQWTNLHNSLSEAFRVLRPGGRFYFATFGERTLSELSDSYNVAREFLKIENLGNTMKFESPRWINRIMASSGFNDITVDCDTIKCDYTSPEALLRSLKSIGAGNPSREFHPSRALLMETFRIYRERYGNEDGVPATFEVVYVSGGRR